MGNGVSTLIAVFHPALKTTTRPIPSLSLSSYRIAPDWRVQLGIVYGLKKRVLPSRNPPFCTRNPSLYFKHVSSLRSWIRRSTAL